jgi:hypothetical protein
MLLESDDMGASGFTGPELALSAHFLEPANDIGHALHGFHASTQAQ